MSTHLVVILAPLLVLGIVGRIVEQRARERRREARKQRQREYRDYLRADHWQRTRAQVLARARGFCEDCGLRTNLDVHHLTYKRKGQERLTDLRALCRSCHTARHQGKRTVLDVLALAVLRRWRLWRYHRTAPV